MRRTLPRKILMAMAGVLLVGIAAGLLADRLGVWILAAALALTLAVGWVVARSVTGSVTRMAAGARALAEGRLETRLRVRPGDELGVLADALNRMAEALSRRMLELSEERARLEGVLESMAEGMMAVDSRGRVLLVNRAWESMFGLRGEEAVGRPYLEAVRSESLRRLVEEVLRQRKPGSAELTISMPEERQFVVQAAVVPECREGSVCAVFVFHDVTELKRLERIRKDFVANVSHELRTPLTAIGGYVEALLDGAKDDPARCEAFLRIVRRHTVQLQNLVEDLLDLSRLESRQLAFRKERVPVGRLAEKARDLAVSRTGMEGKRLPIHVAEGLTVYGDEHQLLRVLVNLLDNALKYAPADSPVRLSAAQGAPPAPLPGMSAWTSAGWPEGDREGIVIRVEDQGMGIPPEDLPRVCERFYRVDKARSRELGGTGLGLAIVKHVMESHGGGLRIESRPGRGTVVTLWLPEHPET